MNLWSQTFYITPYIRSSWLCGWPHAAGKENTGEPSPDVATEEAVAPEIESQQPKENEDSHVPSSPELPPLENQGDRSVLAVVETPGCEVAEIEQPPISPAKCPSPSPPAPTAQDALPEGESEQAREEKVKDEGVEEIKDISESEEVPVVPRIQQWKLREPTQRRGKGRGRGRGRGKNGKGEIGPVEIQDSDEEQAPKQRKTKPGVKPKAKSKAKAKAKASTRKSRKQPVEATRDDDKDQGQKKQKDDVVWKVVENREGLEDLARAFGWATSTQDMSEPEPPAYPQGSAEQPEAPKEFVEVPPVEVEEPESSPPAKRARRGESTRGISFARRFRPKSSPAAERWDAITSMFETEIFPYMVWYGMSSSAFQVEPIFLSI